MSNRLGEHYNRYSHSNYSEHNKKIYDENNFNNVYSQSYNTKYSLTQEPDIEYEKNIHYLSISSRDRDRGVYSNVNNYSIVFPMEFRNISSVELIQAIIPAKNDAEHEPYLLLQIDEIPDVMISNDKYISNCFAMLQLAPPISTNGFIQIDKRIHENTIKIFKTPKANLSRFTISIKDCTGNLFDFGSDTASPDAVDKSLQNTFVFKIVTLEKKRAELNNRSVF
jgi:hypothetical protein